MTTNPTQMLETLLAGGDLSERDAEALIVTMAGGDMAAALAGALLAALRYKGESASEIRGFALAMRRLATRPAIADGPDYVDIVGTGGDGSGSLNLSTGSALLAAACGLAVVKHGNRSITSRSGSADVLASLGLPMPLAEEAAGRCLDATGFTFLFAPHYHPAMQRIGPIRKALGVRTVFNILGPLVNPAEPPYHVIGAASHGVAELMAQTLAGMPIKRAFVVHGAAGWDEATPIGPFHCYDVRNGQVTHGMRDPLDYGIEPCSASDLLGGDAADNAAHLRAALTGGDSQAHRDALALGAALALEVTGAVADAASGIARARAALNDGSAVRFLAKLDAFAAAESA
jgi:anthranilate phosphoribosyltransferase